MASPPNRRIKHIDNWEVEVFISDSMLARAKSGNTAAQSAIRGIFRRAGKKKYESKFTPRPYIQWSQFAITDLPKEVIVSDVSDAEALPPSTLSGWTGECCDVENCEWCVADNKGAPEHRRCEFGCTLRKVS